MGTEGDKYTVVPRVVEMVAEHEELGEVQAYWRPKRMRQRRSGKGRGQPEERDKPRVKKGMKPEPGKGKQS